MKLKTKKKRKVYARPMPARSAADPALASAPVPKAAPSRQYLSVDSVLEPRMIPYLFWREWGRALERGDYLFMWDMTAADSDARTLFGDREAFPNVCRKKLRPLPGIHAAMLQKIRLNGPDEAHIIQVVGHDERSQSLYTAERWFLLRSELGWRIYQVDTIQVPRSTRPNEIQIDQFPTVTIPADYVAPVVEMVVPEDVAGAPETKEEVEEAVAAADHS